MESLWGVNDKAPAFAVAYSEDLLIWRPQDYPVLREKGVLNLLRTKCKMVRGMCMLRPEKVKDICMVISRCVILGRFIDGYGR